MDDLFFVLTRQPHQKRTCINSAPATCYYMLQHVLLFSCTIALSSVTAVTNLMLVYRRCNNSSCVYQRWNRVTIFDPVTRFHAWRIPLATTTSKLFQNFTAATSQHARRRCVHGVSKCIDVDVDCIRSSSSSRQLSSLVDQ